MVIFRALKLYRERSVEIDDLYDFWMAETILRKIKMNFENKKFLILGSNGLIANVLCQALAETGSGLILVDQHKKNKML